MPWFPLITLGFLFHSYITPGLPQVNISERSSSVFCTVEDASNELFFVEPLDQSNITKLITRLGYWGTGQLLWHIKEMNRLGDCIRHVHPLWFLSYIYSQPELIKCMKLINSSYFKRKEFIKGFSERMEMEAQKNNLLPYIKDFSKRVGCDKWEDILIFFDRHDWAGLLVYLDELRFQKAH